MRVSIITSTVTARNAFFIWRKSPVTCIAEIFQKTRTIHRSHQKPALVGFALASPLKLLDLTGAFTTRIGASMGLLSGARRIDRNWARGLYAAYPEAQGIAYLRHRPQRTRYGGATLVTRLPQSAE